MAIVYLEELVKQVPNKYLAVNVIAKRARSLNDELLGAGLSKKQKPVSVATEELAAGDLYYKKLDPKPPENDTPSIFKSESAGYDVVDAEDHLADLYGESSTEESSTEESSTEESSTEESSTEESSTEESSTDSDSETDDDKRTDNEE